MCSRDRSRAGQRHTDEEDHTAGGGGVAPEEDGEKWPRVWTISGAGMGLGGWRITWGLESSWPMLDDGGIRRRAVPCAIRVSAPETRELTRAWHTLLVLGTWLLILGSVHVEHVK